MHVIRPSRLLAGQDAASYTVADGILSDGTGEPVLTPETRVLLRHDRTRRDAAAGRGTGTALFRREQLRSLLSSVYNLDAHWMSRRRVAARWEDDKPGQAALAREAGLTAISTVPYQRRRCLLRFRAQPARRRRREACPPVDGGPRRIAFGRNRRGIHAAALVRSGAGARWQSRGRPGPSPAVRPQGSPAPLHGLGDRTLTCRIDSQRSNNTSHDWRRYDFPATPHTAVPLDPDVERAVLTLVRTAGVAFAAVDLIVRPDGGVVFVELNPSGQFAWLEALTGLDIPGAVVDWLLAPGG